VEYSLAKIPNSDVICWNVVGPDHKSKLRKEFGVSLEPPIESLLGVKPTSLVFIDETKTCI
jgi:hypothetical protein